jgi:hypothetical protein
MLLIHQLPCHDTMRFIRASSYGDSQDVIVNVALVAIRTGYPHVVKINK